MRGAGCAVNDFWDKDIDAKTERTKSRPVAAGELTRKQALVCAGALAFLASLLLPFLSWEAVVAALALAPMAALYPLAKRYTGYPQLILALTFGGGALMGEAATYPKGITLTGTLIYFACVCWIFGYDTVYAFQDMQDDRRNGARSSALTLGRYARIWVRASYVASLSLFAAAGYNVGANMAYYVGCAVFAATCVISVWCEENNKCAPGTAFALHAAAGVPLWAGALLQG